MAISTWWSISEVDSTLGKHFTKENIESKGKKFIDLVNKSMAYTPVDTNDQKLLKQVFDYCKAYSPTLMRGYASGVPGVNQFYTDLGIYLNSLIFFSIIVIVDFERFESFGRSGSSN